MLFRSSLNHLVYSLVLTVNLVEYALAERSQSTNLLSVSSFLQYSLIIRTTLTYSSFTSKMDGRDRSISFVLHITARSHESSCDPQLDRTVVVSKGKLNQAQLEEYQSDAIALYQQKEPQGKILSISPNTDTSALLITVDSIQKSTLKAFKKKFHDNVFLQLPPEPLTNSDGNIQFPLPPRVNYYNDKQ